MDQEQKRKGSPLVLVLIIIIVVLVVAGAVLLLGKFGKEEFEPAPVGDTSTPLIGYEEGVTVVDDPDALQKAVDEMYKEAAKTGIPLSYENDANSLDGEKVECYIGNPEHSGHDFYIQIFADAELTDQLYLSGLVPPGKAIREINLDRRLSEGNHRVYVAYSQVEDDHATISQQIVVTMDFHVGEDNQ